MAEEQQNIFLFIHNFFNNQKTIFNWSLLKKFLNNNIHNIYQIDHNTGNTVLLSIYSEFIFRNLRQDQYTRKNIKGLITITKLILNHINKTNLLTRNKNGESALILACYSCISKLVKLILDKDSSNEHLFLTDNSGDTALITVCLCDVFNKHIEIEIIKIIKLLLNSNSSLEYLNHLNNNNIKALYACFKDQTINILKELIKVNSSLDHLSFNRHNRDTTILFESLDLINSNYLKEILKIVTNSDVLYYQSPNTGNTALMYALEEYNENTTKTNINTYSQFNNNNSNISLKNYNTNNNSSYNTSKYYSSPSKYSIPSPKQQIYSIEMLKNIKYLLKADSSLDHLLIKNNNNNTPLIFTILKSNLKLFNIILEANSTPEHLSQLDNQGNTILMILCKQNIDSEQFEIFLKLWKNLDLHFFQYLVDQKNNEGLTALQIAQQQQQNNEYTKIIINTLKGEINSRPYGLDYENSQKEWYKRALSKEEWTKQQESKKQELKRMTQENINVNKIPQHIKPDKDIQYQSSYWWLGGGANNKNYILENIILVLIITISSISTTIF